MEDSKTLFWSSKFPWVRERISSKCIDNLGTCPQTGSPALTEANGPVCMWNGQTCRCDSVGF
jgi:hypothetical protein